MVQDTSNSSTSHEAVVDKLWDRYRAIADETITSSIPVVDDKEKRSLMGMFSLFVANCIARWVDRIDREPDEERRKEMLNVLLAEESRLRR